MGLETLTRVLLLGVALGASQAAAMELAAPAEPPGGSEAMSRSSPAKVVSNSQQRVNKARAKNGKGVGDEAASKKRRATAGQSTEGGGESMPENTSPAEPESIALRGVRG